MTGLSCKHSSAGVDQDICLWVWKLWTSSSPTSLLKAESGRAGCSRLCSVAFEYLHGWWLHSIPGQPVPVFSHPHNIKVFYMFEQNFLYFYSCPSYLGTTEKSLVPPSWLSPTPVRYLYQTLEQEKVLVFPKPDLLLWARIHKVYIINCLLDFGSVWALLSLPTFCRVKLLFPFLPPCICLWSFPTGESKCYTAQTKLHKNECCLKLQCSGVWWT